MLTLKTCAPRRHSWLKLSNLAATRHPPRGHAWSWDRVAVSKSTTHGRHYYKKAELTTGPGEESGSPSLSEGIHVTKKEPLGLDGLLRHPAAPTVPIRDLPEPDTNVQVDSDAKLSLPPWSQWKAEFYRQSYDKVLLRNRTMLRDPETAARLADAFVPSGSKDKVIIEAFPGPGTLTRALLALPKKRIRKIIVLENWPEFLGYLRPLQRDSRVHIVPMSGYFWETYDTIEEQGLLQDLERQPWDEVHGQLQFVSHLEQSVYGEQLIHQLVRSIPDQSWIFKYGRVPMHFILNSKVVQRMIASGNDNARCKLSIIAQVTAEITRALPKAAFHPYEKYFFPDQQRSHEMSAINIVPHKKQLIASNLTEHWDYCLRRLFTVRSTAIKTAINNLGPGAPSLLKQLCDPSLPASERIDENTSVRRLTVPQWERIVKAFEEWPFAPESLFVSDAFITDRRH